MCGLLWLFVSSLFPHSLQQIPVSWQPESYNCTGGGKINVRQIFKCPTNFQMPDTILQIQVCVCVCVSVWTKRTAQRERERERERTPERMADVVAAVSGEELPDELAHSSELPNFRYSYDRERYEEGSVGAGWTHPVQYTRWGGRCVSEGKRCCFVVSLICVCVCVSLCVFLMGPHSYTAACVFALCLG